MKQPEDRWGKTLFQGLFETKANVEVGRELLPDPVYADIVLTPTDSLPELPGAGLFVEHTGKRIAIVEPYSSSPSDMDLRTSMAKLQLVLREKYRDKKGPRPVRGCLWILSRYSATDAIQEVFEPSPQELEEGFLHWPGIDPIYFVNTSRIGLRQETLLFKLLAKGRQRNEAIATIVQQELEPYFSLLNEFAEELSIMDKLPEEMTLSDEEQLQDIREMLAAREEALLQVREQKGKQEARQEIAKKMLEIGEPPEKVASLTGLSIEDIQKLQ